MKKIKTQAPIDFNIPAFKFPDIEENNISSDCLLYSYRDLSQPLTSISVIFPGGAYLDKIPGLSYFASQLLKRGTSNRSSVIIAEEIDRLGGKLSFSANRDYLKAGIICLGDFLDSAFEILTDCIFNPVFDETEIERYKLQHLAEIEQELADPSYLTALALNKSMFEPHPYSSPMLGTPESINGITKSDCLSWHDSLMNSAPIKIIAAGNFDSDKLNKLIVKRFASFSHTLVPDFISKNEGEKQNKLIISEKKDLNQVVLRFGRFTIDRRHEDYPAIQFLNTVFGGFFMSRLNNLLREKLGYTYGINSYINTLKCTSVHLISTSINKESTKDSVNKIIGEMNKMRRGKLKEEEFLLSRQYLLGSFLRSAGSTLQIAGLIRNIIVNDLPLEYYDKFYNKIKKLKIEDLFDSQKKYFKSNGLTLAAAGDSSFIAKELNEFGEIEYFNPGS